MFATMKFVLSFCTVWWWW